VVFQRGAVHHPRELFRQLDVGVGDADTTVVYEISAQIRCAESDGVAGPRTLPSAIVSVLASQRERRREQRRRGDIQETVDEPGTAGLTICFAPISQSRQGGADRS